MKEVLERNKTDGSLNYDEINSLLEGVNNEATQVEDEQSNPFNEIVKLSDRDIQEVLREIDRQELAIALKTANIEVKNKIHKNMSKRASTMLQEDMEYMGPVRLKDVFDSQKNILLIIRQLANTGEINLPEDFQLPDNLDQVFENLQPPIPPSRFESTFKNIEEFQAFLTERRQPEIPYGIFPHEITMCRFFESKNSENVLADIEQKNREQGMGNFQIPNTNIKLINYSICPKCEHIFSFRELVNYYINPKPDKIFKNRKEQYREDTRVLCKECDTYFFPALVIADGTPKNEVQFLCKVQTANAIEKFYRYQNGMRVLSAKSKNILERKEAKGKTARAIRNDVLLRELAPKPTLISNLLQYTPANLVINLIDGTNAKKGDVLFGAWQ